MRTRFIERALVDIQDNVGFRVWCLCRAATSWRRGEQMSIFRVRQFADCGIRPPRLIPRSHAQSRQFVSQSLARQSINSTSPSYHARHVCRAHVCATAASRRPVARRIIQRQPNRVVLVALDWLNCIIPQPAACLDAERVAEGADNVASRNEVSRRAYDALCEPSDAGSPPRDPKTPTLKSRLPVTVGPCALGICWQNLPTALKPKRVRVGTAAPGRRHDKTALGWAVPSQGRTTK